MDVFTSTKIDLTLSAPIDGSGKPVLLEGLPGGFAAGDTLTATMYEITGADGTKRTLSMGGLVMALCLTRATELERGIVEIMATMERTSSELERLTKIEEKLVANPPQPLDFSNGLSSADLQALETLGYDVRSYSSVGELYDDIYNEWKYQLPGDEGYHERNTCLQRLAEFDRRADPVTALSDQAALDYMEVASSEVTATQITAIETKMDSLNSFSQETMIELQSQTNKRDQSYDMVANILKSLNGVLIGIANNL